VQSRSTRRVSNAPTDHRIDRLIHLLVKNATVVVPGPKIAAEIGVSRAQVWVWMEKMRALGVNIKGVPAMGYQLQKLPDILAPSLIKPELGHQDIGRKIVHYFKTESTNDLALALSPREGPHGTVLLAEEQTAGRGRMGRKWHSEKSMGIYSSTLLRPPLAPAAAPILTLASALAVREAIRSSTGLVSDIRWPNDLILNGKKVSGILTEMNAEVDRLHSVVLGIGINVNHTSFQAELRDVATSLQIECGRPVSRLQVLVALLKELERHYHLLLDKGNAAIVERWAAASSFAEGKRIRVRKATEEVLATTAGLDVSGALRIRRDDGREELLIAGEIIEVK
jgi:BirA family transcriptional regulator, biotin operon repressor / biotin---[acetyl-CoA-carboxylase] ligase